MVIEKGEDWGRPYDGDGEIVHATDDADLAAKAYSAYEHGGSGSVLTVGSGDVVSALGHSPQGSAPGAKVEPLEFSMDLGLLQLGVDVDDLETTIPFVAHAVARRRRWDWPELVAMNTPLVGSQRLGPKAHPNDNRIDITTGRLPFRQAIEAKRRAVSGSHIPHPNLTVLRRADFVYSAKRPLRVFVDGRAQGRWRHFAVGVIPDAFSLVLPAPD